jgi:glycosyltransferase involved in cell wall biosynthesis
MITISFLTVVKNEEKYIAELLSSILSFNNKFFTCEIVIVDDNSDDDTHRIIKSFQDFHSNIKYFKNSEDGKVAGTIFGIKQCDYEWIKFVDGDDYLNLETLKPDFFTGDVIYHDYLSVRKDAKRLHATKIKDHLKFIKKGRSLPKGMFFCKKDVLLDKFPPPSGMIFEDFWINFVCLTNKNFFYLNQPIYFYRQHDNNFYGDNNRFTREKMKRMGNRYLNVVPKISKRYDFYFDKNLINFALALKNPKFINWIKLISSPYYFLKFSFYAFKARINL